METDYIKCNWNGIFFEVNKYILFSDELRDYCIELENFKDYFFSNVATDWQFEYNQKDVFEFIQSLRYIKITGIYGLIGVKLKNKMFDVLYN